MMRFHFERLLFLQLLIVEYYILHKMAAFLANRRLIPTCCNFPAMTDLHFMDPVTENVKPMECGVEPMLFVKVE